MEIGADLVPILDENAADRLVVAVVDDAGGFHFLQLGVVEGTRAALPLETLQVEKAEADDGDHHEGAHDRQKPRSEINRFTVTGQIPHEIEAKSGV